jgi:hypothetical protein
MKASINLNKVKRSPGKDSNTGPAKYKSGVSNNWVETLRLPNTDFALTEKEYGVSKPLPFLRHEPFIQDSVIG